MEQVHVLQEKMGCDPYVSYFYRSQYCDVD